MRHRVQFSLDGEQITRWFDEASQVDDILGVLPQEATDIKVDKVPYLDSFTFTGELSGDGECFCWLVNEEDLAQVDDVDEYNRRALYPNAILSALGCKGGARYKFTLTREDA